MKELEEMSCALQVSEEEFYRDQDADSPYEYLGGELVVCEPVSTLHDSLFGFLHFVLWGVFEERRDGVVKGPQLPMRLDPKWSPEPDLMVVRDERRHLIGPQRLEGPADLVIEVVSPGDVRRALRIKLPRYRQACVPEIWVVDPYTQSVRVEVLRVSERTATTENPTYRNLEVREGRLESAVFPGFWIDVSWLWQRPLPPAAGCLRQILG